MEAITRAYSLLDVKSLDSERRVITGMATTPSTDRVGDIVEPLGVTAAKTIPLFLYHDSTKTVGTVHLGKPTKAGVPFTATIPKVIEAGALRDRVDEAWQMVKHGLIAAVSIGFRSVENGVEMMKGGGLRFLKSEVLELSLVPVPANAEALIHSVKSESASAERAAADLIHRIKSLHLDQRAAPGAPGDRLPSPGASGNKQQPALSGLFLSRSQKGNPMKTMQELREERTQKAARMSELRALCKAEDRVSSDDEAAEFDVLTGEVKSLDDQIRQKQFDAINAAGAKPVDGSTQEAASRSRDSGSQSYVTTKSNLPKGNRFARVAMAIAAGKGSQSDAVEWAKQWKDTPEVAQFIKAAAGSTTGWGASLVDPANLVGEFLELLRTETFVGKIQGFNRVPFNVQIPVQTGGGTVNWVGEAAAKPVGEQSFTTVSLGINKVSGIVVLTDELVKTATVNAEERVKTDMVSQVAKFLDIAFLDPAATATANRPASVTNGVTATAPSGTSAEAFRADLRTLRAVLRAANLSSAGTALIMSSLVADSVADMTNALGQPEFPDMGTNGGTVRGTQVLVSDNVPAGMVALIHAPSILLADDGQVLLDASREATLDMAGGNVPDFSLWQKNCVGIRAERFITWKKARAAAVAYIAAAAYGS